MIYEYLINTFGKGDPIFFDELPCTSKNYLRQDIKKLVDTGKLNRVYNGVYYLPYTTVLGTPGGMSILKFIEKKFLKNNDSIIGYITGLQLVNRFGFSTQNSAFFDVCSNKATTKQRTIMVDGVKIKVFKPKTTITNDNANTLQFLDLLSFLDTFNELDEKSLIFKLKRFIQLKNIKSSSLKQYLPYYPDRVYKYLYLGGIS